MTTKKLMIAILCIAQLSAFAGKEKTKKPKQIWYKPVTKELKDVTISTKDVFSEKDITKFRFDIKNNSKSFIIFKPNECTLKSGNTEVALNDKKKLVIKPFESDYKILDATSTPEKSVYDMNIQFLVKGFYKVKTGDAEQLPDFTLPPSQKIVEIGDYRIELLNYTFFAPPNLIYGTRCKFKITYIGEGMAVVEPKKITGIVPAGTIIVNSNLEKTFLLGRGESENINVVILSNDLAKIVWNDAFKSATVDKLEDAVLNFDMQ